MSLSDYESALGLDLDCVSDCYPNFRTCSGRINLLNALARRLQAPNGDLFYDPEYGFDLNQFINASVDSYLLNEIRTNVIVECKKDSRVTGCSAQVTYDLSKEAIIVAINVSSVFGNFPLIMSIGKVTVQLLTN